MGENNHSSPGLSTLLGRLSNTVLRGVNARVELLAVELQEEGLRARELVARVIILLICGTMGTVLLTATIIFLFPANARLYVTGALAFLYFCGAAAAGFGLRAGLKREPFSESIDQVKKDRAWLETLK